MKPTKDLVVVTVRLHREDVEAMKQWAEREFSPWQTWLRKAVREAVKRRLSGVKAGVQ